MYERLLTLVTIPPDKFTTQNLRDALRAGGVVEFKGFETLEAEKEEAGQITYVAGSGTTTNNTVYQKKPCVFLVDTTNPHSSNFHSDTLELSSEDPTDTDLISVIQPYIERVLDPIVLGVMSRMLGYPIIDAEELELLTESQDPRVAGIRKQIGFATLMQVEYVQSNKSNHKNCHIELTVLIDERFDEHV
jgi:hypothetical protein